MPALEGKIAIVTGAGRGLGRAIATGFVAASARVAFVDQDRDPVEDAAANLPRDRAVPYTVDVTVDAQVRPLLDDVKRRFGRIDVLVNVAGISENSVREDFLKNPVRFWTVPPELVRRFFDTNGLAPYLLAAQVVPGMIERGWGRIINVTTSLDTMLRPGMAPYGGSKASLEAHTAIMAGDLAGTGVTANVLVPGGPANTRMIPESSGIPRASLIQPEAMVAPAVWLASDESSGVTGRRFLAAKWDKSLAGAEAAERAGAPVGWSQLGAQSIFPGGTNPHR